MRQVGREGGGVIRHLKKRHGINFYKGDYFSRKSFIRMSAIQHVKYFIHFYFKGVAFLVQFFVKTFYLIKYTETILTAKV